MAKHKLTPEDGMATRFKAGKEQAELARKAGIASGIARRRKATISDYVCQIMNSEASESNKAKIKALGVSDEAEITNATLMACKIVQNALQGDIRCIEKCEEYENKGKEEDKTYELPARVIGKAFVDINRNLEPNKSYTFKGGRGGLKSSYISLKIVELLVNHPYMHACIVRKVAGTLKDSVYAQMKWAIRELNMEEEFSYKTSPLEIRYKKTGQVIYFRGADDPIKLKSIKPPFGYLGILWKEEKDQLAGDAEERSINQSVLRGAGTEFYDFSSYNPPKSKDNWVNRLLLEPDPNRVVHTSTYVDAPAEWLGVKFIEDAKHLKEINPDAYEHEYMGVPNGQGGNVFENLEIRDITDEEVSHMDTIYQGLDFGWYPDPSAFVRLHYDHDSETIYFIDEFYKNKFPAQAKVEWLEEKGYTDYIITCDSAGPEQINDLRTLGIQAKGAVKGAGSVEYGMQWLLCRKIVIDPRRTPNVYEEFSKYEYERDKDENIISGYPDANNHLIDATRYALERFCNKRFTQA